MFNCIKTGFYAITPSLHYLYGDAFGLPGTDWPDKAIDRPDSYLLLRITAMSSEKPARVQINLRTWSHWFEERAGDILSPAPDLAVVWRPCSTLIASPGQWSWLGYDGEPM